MTGMTSPDVLEVDPFNVTEAVESAPRELPDSKLVDRDVIVNVLLDLRRRFTTS